jgi:hypothetical protein
MVIVSNNTQQTKTRTDMGFNTTVILLNDAAGEIEKDADFGKKLVDAIHRVAPSKPVDVSAKNGRVIAGNAATVVETHHNSSTAIIAVGGNFATVLAWAGDVNHSTDEGKLACLKALASELGFLLVKEEKK